MSFERFKVFIYDIETLANVFTFTAIDSKTHDTYYFEISPWRNDYTEFVQFIFWCKSKGVYFVGFNNLFFDYTVIHKLITEYNKNVKPEQIYQIAQNIINVPEHKKWDVMLWESDHIVKQIDLYKIHHFDNKAKITGLKVLEFNMRMSNVEEMPFHHSDILTKDDVPVLAAYNLHDCKATLRFYYRSIEMIQMRYDLSLKYDKNMINYNDVKIGETILIDELEKAGVECYEKKGHKKVKKQTHRKSVDLSDVIFPYVKFEREEFNSVLGYLNSKTISETKGIFNKLIADVDGLEYKFGTGGIHASINNKIVESNEDYQIVDVDVAGYYPSLAIANQLYPEHLGRDFCRAYGKLPETRAKYPKGTPMNGAYKLAGNGAYGNSNNKFSVFYDWKYTMSITINGQLLLCMLVEQLIKVPKLKMIQANTDGVTFYCPRDYLEHVRNVCRWWERYTALRLEEVLYKKMFIRDVNSYICVKEDGGVKRIGAYSHETAEQNIGTRELPYHKDWSHRVVALAAEAALVYNKDISEFIKNHDDIYDFFLRTKVPKSSRLELGKRVVPNVIRYYISTTGKELIKHMPCKYAIGAYKIKAKLSESDFIEVARELLNDQSISLPDNSLKLMEKLQNENTLLLSLPWDERIHTKSKSKYENTETRFHSGYKVTLNNKIEKDHDYSNIDYDWYIQETEKLVNNLEKW